MPETRELKLNGDQLKLLQEIHTRATSIEYQGFQTNEARAAISIIKELSSGHFISPDYVRQKFNFLFLADQVVSKSNNPRQ